ncbi:MAG: hypothetical protein JJT87_19240 [Halomonas sp.]|nr:hypothetical protein [Halomonas sp.]MCC5904051.1 hypothetical protein [Halomonas sp.]
MPPLLIDYFSQSMEVVFQPQPESSTDWVAFWGTLLGAAVGAVSGAILSYYATVRARKNAVIADSTEKIYSTLMRCRLELDFVDRKRTDNYLHKYYKKNGEPPYRISDFEEALYSRLTDIAILIELNYPKLKGDSVNLINKLSEWHAHAKILPRGDEPGMNDVTGSQAQRMSLHLKQSSEEYRRKRHALQAEISGLIGKMEKKI